MHSCWALTSWPWPGCSLGSLLWRINAIHESPTLMTYTLPKAPPPDKIIFGGRISTYEFSYYKHQTVIGKMYRHKETNTPRDTQACWFFASGSVSLSLSLTHTHTHPFPHVPWIEFCKQYVTASTFGSAPPGMIIEPTRRKAFSSPFPLRRLWFLGMRKAYDKMLGVNWKSN